MSAGDILISTLTTLPVIVQLSLYRTDHQMNQDKETRRTGW